jgi:hypothetical protein
MFRKKKPQITAFQFERIYVRDVIDLLEELSETHDVVSDGIATVLEQDIYASAIKTRKRMLKVTLRKVGKKNFYTIPDVSERLAAKRVPLRIESVIKEAKPVVIEE